MPSVRPRIPRLGVLAVCGLLLSGAAAGCSTTQEKAEIQQAQAKHILEARAKRQQQKHEQGQARQAGREGELER